MQYINPHIENADDCHAQKNEALVHTEIAEFICNTANQVKGNQKSNFFQLGKQVGALRKV